ncbi:MAG TPA: MFS transporter [Candidatus Binatia bacterium]|nr:MFS transporter [Candidatus Binatia bacterium]
MPGRRVARRQPVDPTAGLVGGAAAVSVAGLIFLGSGNLCHFDWALLPYAVAAIVSAAATAYRVTLWLQRPPTRRYWRQGWRLFRRGGALRHGVSLTRSLLANFAAQRFIARRSRRRWLTHLCLSWGSMLAFALTFPLVFGWVHFATPAADLHTYQLFVLGVRVQEFSVDSLPALLLFNALNFSAALVLGGVALSLHRRLTESGALALQQFGQDLFPLLLLSAVAATGLGLTVSAHWLHGRGFRFLAFAHAAAVVALLFSLPFGKLFHIFQRPLHLSVGLYKQAAQAGPQARCVRCRQPFASQMQVQDLEQVLAELAFDYRPNGPAPPYQQVCPPCRRKLLALNQARTLGGVGGWGLGVSKREDEGQQNTTPQPLGSHPFFES